ncbi:RHS repeat-associated core domain-containing protein [Sorangium sp. So ce1128]
MGLTGHEHDDELGLINLKGRMYDPKLKRVLTPDPMVSAPLFGQSYNRYSYVLNDPLNLVDPTGYEPMGPDCTTCAPWTSPQPPWVEGGGGVTIIFGGSGDGDDGNPYTAEPGATDGYNTGPPPPPPVVRSDAEEAGGGPARGWRPRNPARESRALRATEELSSKSQAVKMSKLISGKNGFGPFSPIDAIESGGALYIVDGHHRASAAIRARLGQVPVRVQMVSSDEEAQQLFRSWASALTDKGF